MSDGVRIWPYQGDDLPRVEALETRVQPYRPEDEAEVQAMYMRALLAEQAGDPGWMAPPPRSTRPIEEDFEAFWVAEGDGREGKERYDTLIVNTTTPQRPALGLYRKLGFRDVGVSYIGRYELTWLELPL